ncbi:MAG: SDR family oxidoreductase [Planctomycetaceae bacterium]
MQIADAVIVVTGGASGIGQGLCRRFAADGAAAVIVADRDQEGGERLAAEIGGVFLPCDVAEESQVQQLVEQTIAQWGRIDLFCSNAGVTVKGGEEATDDQWGLNWQINVMSHVYASRHVLPGMVARKQGAFLVTSSAAGLLTEIGSAPYSATKHAAVGFAEWLSVRYRREGVHISCLCPAGVATEFLDLEDPIHRFLHTSSVTPDELAGQVVEGLAAEKFLIVSHKEVTDFFQFKTQDYDRWLHNFSRLRQKAERDTARSREAS